MRRESFEPLWRLFGLAERPAKEMTESFSALEHLRPILAVHERCRVIHVGDGAHARTGALFALKTLADNISVDPTLHAGRVSDWCSRFGIRRLEWRKAKIEDAIDELNGLPAMPVLVTFVHAHVDIDAVLERLRWNAAFTLACCLPGHQLTRKYVPYAEGEDPYVLSEGRRFQVLVHDVPPSGE